MEDILSKDKKFCEQCDIDFIPKRPEQKFCSIACSNTHRHERKKLEPPKVCYCCCKALPAGNDGCQNNDEEDNTLCRPCIFHLYYSPKRTALTIGFLGRQVIISFEIRKGQCSCCERTDVNTDMHHWFYITAMPWACTVELCDSCHQHHHRDKEKRLTNVG